MPQLATEHLLKEHREIEKILAELDIALAPFRNKTPITAEETKTLCGVSCQLLEQLLPHLAKEDRVLYPALEEFLPRYEGPLAVLRGDQGVLLAHSERLRDAGRGLSALEPPQVAHEFHAAACTTLRLARDHIYKQEIVFFPMIVRFVSPERDAQLLARMEALSGEEGPGPARNLGA